MKEAYPELEETHARVDRVLDEEERRFTRTVEVGLKKLDPLAGSRLPYLAPKAFKLYDTYGLPRDFIEDVTRDAGIQVDWAGFDAAMQEQRTRAKASWKGANKDVARPVYAKLADTYRTEPDFYFGTKVTDCLIEAIITKDGSVNEIKAGDGGRNRSRPHRNLLRIRRPGRRYRRLLR